MNERRLLWENVYRVYIRPNIHMTCLEALLVSFPNPKKRGDDLNEGVAHSVGVRWVGRHAPSLGARTRGFEFALELYKLNAPDSVHLLVLH